MADKIRVKSNFDKKGNYEPSDSEGEYSPKEKKLLDKLRKRKHESESEEEMYAFSESDDDSDAKKEDMGMADSDVEGQEKSDDDLPDSKAWGKKKKTYHATDYVDEDYGGFGNDEEAALMEEEEAKNIQKRLLEQLGEEDFTLDFFTKHAPKSDGELKETVIKSDLSQMSKRQKLQLFEKESPEFAGLIDDFKSKLSVAKDDLHPVVELVKDGKLPPCPTSELVTTKYNLILNYCTNISFYLLLKSQRVNIQNHPVVKRMFLYRQMLNKLEPLYEEVVKPQIGQILEAVKQNVSIYFDKETLDTKKHKDSKKHKSKSSQPKPKKLKLITDLEKDDSEDTGVSNDEENYDGDDFFSGKVNNERTNDESEESGFSDNDANINDDEGDDEQAEDLMQPSTSQAIVSEEVGDKREITYQIAKNKGLTPHRKKEQRNPRVKHKLKFRKAKIRRKGAIREPRTEVSRYGGEASGIKANVKKSIKIK